MFQRPFHVTAWGLAPHVSYSELGTEAAPKSGSSRGRRREAEVFTALPRFFGFFDHREVSHRKVLINLTNQCTVTVATHLSLVSCLSRVSAPPGSLVASAGHASHAPPRQRRSEPPSAKRPAASASKSRRRRPYAQRDGRGAVIRSAPRTRRGLGGPGAWRPAPHDGRTSAGGPHARAVTHRTPARAASLRDISRLDHSCRVVSRGPQTPTF